MTRLKDDIRHIEKELGREMTNWEVIQSFLYKHDY